MEFDFFRSQETEVFNSSSYTKVTAHFQTIQISIYQFVGVLLDEYAQTNPSFFLYIHFLLVDKDAVQIYCLCKFGLETSIEDTKN